MSRQKTDFGFETIPLDEKQGKVNDVFNRVASRYDLMNDLMSGGLHRLWKHQVILLAKIRPYHSVLDLAGGTGDLTQRIVKKKGLSKAPTVLADINFEMLQVGRDRLTDQGLMDKVQITNVDAQQLPYHDLSFDRVIIGFGLRNVPEKDQALKEMFRVLKPGGQLLVLEFSELKSKPLKPVYDFYSFNVLPWLGKKVANDAKSYQYLAESIRKHPNQEQLNQLILEQGFEQCEYFNVCMGVVAIHRALKL